MVTVHILVRFAGLHQDELQLKLPGGGLRHDLHLLHLDVDERVRLHQAPIEG
jgi:hypothetical protein